MNKVFQNSSKFLNWLVVSSQDSTQVATTVKGIVGLFVVFLLTLLPQLGVQINPDLANLPDMIYSLVVSLLSLVSGVVFIAGLARKIVNTITSK
jgi:hypothetical protein